MTIFTAGRLCLLVLLLGSTASRAGEAYQVELSMKIPGSNDATYLDLAKMVLPDLVRFGDGHQGTQIVAMRAIGGGDSGGLPPQSFCLWGASALDVASSGRERLLMLFDIGSSSDGTEGFAPLALYDLSGKPKLLDVVNVATDRGTSFREPASLAIGRGDHAVATVSSHFNSSQGYSISPLMMIRNDRVELIDTIYTFDENQCNFRRTQQIGYRPIPDGEPYAAIEANVTVTTSPGEEQCEQPALDASVRRIRVTYRWDPVDSRYVPDSDAFEKLAAENAERF